MRRFLPDTIVPALAVVFTIVGTVGAAPPTPELVGPLYIDQVVERIGNEQAVMARNASAENVERRAMMGWRLVALALLEPAALDERPTVVLHGLRMARLRHDFDDAVRGGRFHQDALARFASDAARASAAPGVMAAGDVDRFLDSLLAGLGRDDIEPWPAGRDAQGDAATSLDSLVTATRAQARAVDLARGGEPHVETIVSVIQADVPRAQTGEVRLALETIAGVSQLFLTSNETGAPALPAAIRTARDRAARRARDAAAAALDALAAVPEIIAHGQTAEAAALRAQCETMQWQLSLFAAMPAWFDVVNAAHPRQRTAFERVARRLANQATKRELDQATRRDIDAVAEAMRRFAVLPLETRLRRGDRQLKEMLSGHDDVVLRAIDDARRTWIEGLCGQRDQSSAIVAMDRFLHACADADAAVDPDALVARMNGWGGWDLPPALARRLLTDRAGRVRLAAASLAAGDRRSFERQLDVLSKQRDVVQLMLALDARLATLMPVPDDALMAGLAALATVPRTTSWCADHREALAQVARWTIERDVARVARRDRDVERIDEFLTSACADLLATIGVDSGS